MLWLRLGSSLSFDHNERLILLTPFFYACCQHGIQSLVKEQLCDGDETYRLAYSRPGFITLKANFPNDVWSTTVPRGPFVRASGHIVSKIEGSSTGELVAGTLAQVNELDWQSMHIWQPDSHVPGHRGYEPGPNELTQAIGEQFSSELERRGDPRSLQINRHCGKNTRVLDIIVEQPNRWWIGTHLVSQIYDSWPGGVPILQLPVSMISRAYLKIAEAVAWSQMPIRPGDTFVEIGSSPGGACQFLLQQQLRVTGVDPAEMDESIVEHPKFTHVRGRAIALKRRLFAQFRYLACDANVAPNYTLDTVEAIVMHPSNRLSGILLTLKLKDIEAAKGVPEMLTRLETWGFDQVELRQLAYNRREITAALIR